MADKTVYIKTLLTGGTGAALDSLDGDTLLDGDVCLIGTVPTGDELSFYVLDADSAAAESSPNVIAPDTNPGNKRWLLQILAPKTINLTGGQIAFPATAVPSADPNTLDDYEEGEFTVTMVASSSGTITVNTSNNTMAYTKNGRDVKIQGLIIMSGVSSPIGVPTIEGLPFTSMASTEGSGFSSLSIRGNDLAAGAITSMVGYIAPSVTNITIGFFEAGSTTDDALLIDASPGFENLVI